jgi:hypothetical protein
LTTVSEGEIRAVVMTSCGRLAVVVASLLAKIACELAAPIRPRPLLVKVPACQPCTKAVTSTLSDPVDEGVKLASAVALKLVVAKLFQVTLVSTQLAVRRLTVTILVPLVVTTSFKVAPVIVSFEGIEGKVKPINARVRAALLPLAVARRVVEVPLFWLIDPSLIQESRSAVTV